MPATPEKEMMLSRRNIAGKVFDRFDPKGTGYIESKNLDDAIHILGLDVSSTEDAKVILSKRDKIRRNDFVEWYEDFLHCSNQSSSASSPVSPQRLIDARRDRKITERDAELLRNRIKLLEREEHKTLKRIAQANKRAAIIFNQKKNSTNKHDERNRYRENRQREIRAKHEKNSIRNELSRAAKLKSVTSMTEQKWQNALDIKRGRRELEAQKRDQEREFLSRAKLHHNTVMEQRRSQAQHRQERLEKLKEKRERTYLSKVVA